MKKSMVVYVTLEQGAFCTVYKCKVNREVFDAFFFHNPDVREYECGRQFDGMPYRLFCNFVQDCIKVTVVPDVFKADTLYTFVA